MKTKTMGPIECLAELKRVMDENKNYCMDDNQLMVLIDILRAQLLLRRTPDKNTDKDMLEYLSYEL